MTIKERVLTHWTFARALYFVIGSVILVESIMSGQYIGVLFGGYFASMGLFAFGCAAGNCYGGNCTVETKTEKTAKVE